MVRVETSQLTFDNIAYILCIFLSFRTLHYVVPRCALAKSAERPDTTGWEPLHRGILYGQSGQVLIRVLVFRPGSAYSTVHPEQSTTGVNRPWLVFAQQKVLKVRGDRA